MKADYYVVLEFNQASGLPDGQHVELYDSPEEAHDMAAELAAATRKTGRRETYRVFELNEVEGGEVR